MSSPMSYAEQQQMSAADLAASSKTLSLVMPRTASTTPPEASPRSRLEELPHRPGLPAKFDSSRAFSLPNLLDAWSLSRDATPERPRNSLGSVYSFTPGCDDSLYGYVGQPTGLPGPHADARWPPRPEYFGPCYPPAIDESAMPPPPTMPAPVHPYQRARSLVRGLWNELAYQGELDPRATVSEILHSSLTLLGEHTHDSQKTSLMIAHPDEFKNPSSFLKIYGDPLCFSDRGPLPRRGKHGNWQCAACKNVNFPRRFKCHKCATVRDTAGDKIVSEYARNVYRKFASRASTGGARKSCVFSCAPTRGDCDHQSGWS